jgi:hypothetical protein
MQCVWQRGPYSVLLYTPDDAILKWTLAKRKMIILKYGTHGGNTIAHAALLSDVSHDDRYGHATLDMPPTNMMTQR